MSDVKDVQSVEPQTETSNAAARDATIPDAPRRRSLNSPARVKAIHPSIKEIKMPIQAAAGTDVDGDVDTKRKPEDALDALDARPATNLHPVTLQPFTVDDLHVNGIESLLRQYTSPDAAARARDDTAKELRKLLDENQRKTKEIDRELEEKEKTREMERKVYARKLGKDG